MSTIVSDNFTRADNPTSLGTATTGQTWSQVAGASGAFSISSNTALWTWNFGEVVGRVIIESGFTNAVTKVTLVNPTTGSGNFGIGEGLIFRYVDANFLWRLIYTRSIGTTNQLRLQRTYSGSTSTVLDLAITLADNDTISCGYCESIFKVYVNDVLQGTYDDTGQPQNYGTMCGLIGNSGSFFSTITKNFDNFLVTTSPDCSVPTDALLPAFTLSGAGSPSGRGTDTKRVDAGPGNAYYVVLPVSDAGDELRSHVVKSARVAGKRTNVTITGWGYDVNTPVNISDLENGTNSSTGALAVADSTQVSQSPLIGINIPNAVLSTVRVDGDDTGEDTRDQIHEILYQRASMGVRR